MPHCDCGFDFGKARLKRQAVVSYALLPDKTYKAAIRREHRILVEQNSERKLRLIAKAASSVGSLHQCPNCGAWLLAEPLKRGRDAYALLRKVPTGTEPERVTHRRRPT